MNTKVQNSIHLLGYVIEDVISDQYIFESYKAKIIEKLTF